VKDARPVLRGVLRQSVDDGDGLGPTAGAAQTIDAGDRECYAYSPKALQGLAASGHPLGDPASGSVSGFQSRSAKTRESRGASGEHPANSIGRRTLIVEESCPEGHAPTERIWPQWRDGMTISTDQLYGGFFGTEVERISQANYAPELGAYVNHSLCIDSNRPESVVDIDSSWTHIHVPCLLHRRCPAEC
jgi:hypothetical protein